MNNFLPAAGKEAINVVGWEDNRLTFAWFTLHSDSVLGYNKQGSVSSELE